MKDTTFSCSHLSNSLFLSARKQFEMSKSSTTAKAKACCLFSRQCVPVGSDYSSNPQSPGEYEILSCVNLGRMKYRLRCCSVQHASGNREYTRKVVLNMKNLLDAMKASRKYLWTPRRCTFRYGRDLWLHRCRRHCTWTLSYEKNLEIFKNSEFENIKELFHITRMVIEGNSEIKSVFSADVAGSLWEKSVLLTDQAIKWTKARVFVYSVSVLCMGKCSVLRCIQKVE